MGGNLFKDVGAQRVTKEEYYNFVKEISEIFTKNNITEFRVTESVREKESFGDIDILVSEESKLSCKKIQDMFESKHVQSTAGGISFLYENVQVDLIVIKRMNMEVSALFYDWNDLGNMIGRLCKHHRCKLKPTGLYFAYYDSEDKSKKIGEYFLTSDTKDILDFIGLDYSKYKKGFDTFNEMFKFVQDSKYFNKRFFVSREFNNHNALKRDNHRQVFLKLLDYIEENGIVDSEIVRPSLQDTIDMLDSRYPVELKQRIERDVARMEIYKKISSKWNGHLFMSITGLQGKELGSFVKHLNSKYHNKNFVLGLTEQEIEKIVKDEHISFLIDTVG